MVQSDSTPSYSRRNYLRTLAAAAGGVLVAGCLGAQGDGHNLPDDFEQSDYPPRLTAGDPTPDEHWAVIVSSEADADELFTDEDLAEDSAENVWDFINETDFDEELLIYLEYWVPDPGYDLRIDSITDDGEQIQIGLESEVVVEGDMPQVPWPRRILLRYTFGESLPPIVRVTYRNETHEAVVAENFEGY